MQLEHRTFRTTSDDVAANPEFEAWWQAVGQGFHEGLQQDQTIEWTLKQSVADNWLLRGCYDTDLPPQALSSIHPIGTFVSFEKTLNVGNDTLMPAHLVSQVTVRPTHRRKGILRQMMTDDLTWAHEQGAPLAALTATEATIYGRFGFGPASFCNTLRVDTSPRFGLRNPVPGRVELTTQQMMSELAPQIYERCHQVTLGSVGREHFYAEESAGLFDLDTQKRNHKVRNAVHLAEDGTPDGFVSYIVESNERPRSLKILDLCAVDGGAYLGLWDFLGSIDLVEAVTWNSAPVDDPLRWALVDQRSHRVESIDDRLWLRILDPVAALQGRTYACEDLDLVLAVTDPMGFAAGTFAVEVRQRAATVTASDDPADVTLGVEELGSLFLGGVDPEVLAMSGRIQAGPEAVASLRALFGGFRRPWCNTDF